MTLFIIATVQFLTPFMFSAVGVALPTIGRDFSASAVQLSLIEMTYILGVALFLLPTGRFADIHGRKKIFLTGAGVLTAATLALPLTSTISTFILFRFIQGIGAAMITSTSLAILTAVYPEETRGRAMGLVVCSVYLGLSAGPTLAGLMTTYLSWRWIFFLSVPVEIFALLLACIFLKGEWAGTREDRFDWIGSGIYIFSLSALIIGITQLQQWPSSQFFALAGAAGMVVFYRYESRTPSPLVNINSILKNKPFAYSNIATWINYAASFGVIFFFSIYLQVVKNLSPRDAGMVLVVQPLIQAIIAPFSGILSDRYEPVKIATLGMALCSLALFAAANLDAESSFTQIIAILFLLGSGFGFFSTPNTAAVMASITPRHYGMASSMIATMRAAGMLTSMTIIALLLSLYLGEDQVSKTTEPAFIDCMQTTLILFALMSIIGIGFSLGRHLSLPSN